MCSGMFSVRSDGFVAECSRVNAFESACEVERRSWQIMQRVFARRAFNGQFVVTYKGRLATELQRMYGDVFFNSDAETVCVVEIKAEESNLWGNAFLEAYSNRSRGTKGWMHTLNADRLLLHFCEQDLAYWIDFPRLKAWCFDQGNIERFPLKPQRKRQQANDTWGYCVPLDVLVREVGAKSFRPQAYLDQLTLFDDEDVPL